MKVLLTVKKLQLVFLTIYFITIQSVNAVCNVCQENYAACVNLTSYHMCFASKKPDTKQLFICPDGLVCTNMPNICFQRSTLPASCGDTSSCHKCNSNQVFACTSRTTFAFCFGSTIPSKLEGSCPPGKICDASSVYFCVDKLKPSSVVCDLEPQSTKSFFRNFVSPFNDFNS